MNINFFITSLGGGGAERVVCNLANFLVKRMHLVTITVLRGNDKTYELEKGVEVKYLQPTYYKEKRNILNRCNEINTTISFLKHMPKDALLVSLLELPVAYSLIFRSIYKQKLIICERNNPEFYSTVYQEIFRRFSHRADGCICQTQSIMNWYLSHLSVNTRYSVIPNTINGEILSSKIGGRGNKVIMTMGRLETQKNQQMLISAFAEVIKNYPEYILNIYGKGPLEKQLQEQIVSLGIEENVNLKGFTKDTVSAFKESSLFVLTSNHEGMPNVLAEAMAMGLTCIATDCGGGGARELINDGINGVLIPKNDKEALVIAIMSILENEVYASHLSNHAVKIRERLNPEIIHEQWEIFFEQFQ